MNYGEKRVWHAKDTWRNVAFRRYFDSREWRRLLEINPSYDIRYEPHPGTTINLTGRDNQGKIKSGGKASKGTLAQVGTNLDLTASPSSNPDSVKAEIFPYDKYSDYTNRLGQYTAMALLAPDRTNGYSLDSPQAQSDSQRG